MARQRIDQLRALTDQTLMRAERHSAALRLGALHRDEAHSRARGRLGDRLRVGTIVLLAFDERLHVDRRHQPDRMTTLLGHTTPMMGRRPSFHRHDAGRLIGKECGKSRARQSAVVENRPVRPYSADLKAALRQIDCQHADRRHP